MAQISGIHVGDTGATYDVDTNAGPATDETQRLVLAVPAIVETDIAEASSASAVEVVAAFARTNMVLTNTDANRVYLKWGANPTTTDWHFYIEPNERWVMGEAERMGAALNAIWDDDGTGALIGYEA